MIQNSIIRLNSASDSLLANLESRDAALWIHDLPADATRQEELARFLGLPWRLILSETFHDAFSTLEESESFSEAMTRKRGFAQLIDIDASRIELPQRCLPIYLLNGRQPGSQPADFASRLRRMTMLEELRRSGVRELVILSSHSDPVPADLLELWASGFRAYVTFVADAPDVQSQLTPWVGKAEGLAATNLIQASALDFVADILSRYTKTYPEDKHIVRMRDRKGVLHRIDVTGADEPERPILERYTLIEERDVVPLVAEEITEDEFVGFFKNPTAAWRPFAAGVPWIREPKCKLILNSLLRKLDTIGPQENCIAYISAESGAGGTTLARWLAWEAAKDGYPVLVAKPLAFIPDALSITNYLNRVHQKAEHQITAEVESEDSSGSDEQHHGGQNQPPRYETPWVIVFDTLHWQSRDSELARFRNDLEKSGRPVCILAVTGTVLGISFFNTSVFKKVADLNHNLDRDEARQLGRHLNKFLRVYGKARQDYQWDRFYEEHTVRYLNGLAAFWVTLSFWIQGQYDLTESIQSWMFRKFKDTVEDKILREAILEIAAVSSERLPLPEGLLPTSAGRWPISHLLEDSRSDLSALGLVRISENGERHWALIHDILGRFLINALFYDFPTREELGYADAKDAEHLRFLILQKISRKPSMAEREYRSIAEEFATSIFKIDPGHGYGSFTSIWREVLAALDEMPRPLRDTSRVFRHHTAISRRRITKLDETYYGVSRDEKYSLLNRAIEDITYALTYIEYTPGSESNLNLFNSLANAYLDLAELQAAAGASQEQVNELRRLANEATRKAYAENPTNSFVIETYVKNLLEGESGVLIENCIEALGILFEALISNEAAYRKSQLGTLADEALQILFDQAPGSVGTFEPSKPIDVLIRAWQLLAEGRNQTAGMAFSEVPTENRERALVALTHPVGLGNMQVIRLSYDLTCIGHPYNYKKQLEFVEQLQAMDYKMTPQLRLEYAILLFMNDRHTEGDKTFRALRQVWRESEQFVQVPVRLRWLRSRESGELRTVHAYVGSDSGNRAMVRVQEFSNGTVPFRPEEFGIQDLTPRLRFTGLVSFGHNGPFLRPVTAHVQ